MLQCEVADRLQYPLHPPLSPLYHALNRRLWPGTPKHCRPARPPCIHLEENVARCTAPPSNSTIPLAPTSAATPAGIAAPLSSETALGTAGVTGSDSNTAPGETAGSGPSLAALPRLCRCGCERRSCGGGRDALRPPCEAKGRGRQQVGGGVMLPADGLRACTWEKRNTSDDQVPAQLPQTRLPAEASPWCLPRPNPKRA